MTQDEYIAILWNDCGFDTLSQRRAFLQREFGARYVLPLSYADELNPSDKSRLIEILKDVKAGQRERARADWEDND